MEAFGIIAFSIGTVGMTFGIIALAKVTQLEQALKQSGVLEKD